VQEAKHICRAAPAQMKQFCADETSCRHAALIRYFGETPSAAVFCDGRCQGHCDACARAAGAMPQPGDWSDQVNCQGFGAPGRVQSFRC